MLKCFLVFVVGIVLFLFVVFVYVEVLKEFKVLVIFDEVFIELLCKFKLFGVYLEK